MSNDIYKLGLVKNIIINIKDKHNSQICHCNYQILNFSTFHVFLIEYLMNKLGISINLEI